MATFSPFYFFYFPSPKLFFVNFPQLPQFHTGKGMHKDCKIATEDIHKNLPALSLGAIFL